MNADLKNNAAVELRDEYSVELRRGVEAARAFYANGRRSLVASISLDDFALWSGEDERALVSDPDGVDLPDNDFPIY